MNDKQKIKAKIGKLKSEYNKESDFRTVRGDTAREVLDKLLSFIDSIPEEPVSKTLELAADSYASTFSEKSRIIAYDAYKMGATWQEQKMMKDAVDGRVDRMIQRSWVNIDHNDLEVCLRKFDKGEKVKVIIIKEDEKMSHDMYTIEEQKKEQLELLQRRIVEASIDYQLSKRPISLAGDKFADEARRLNRNQSFIDGANFILDNQWISVEDECPIGTCVLFDKNGNMRLDRFAWRALGYVQKLEITHWLPIPNLPKGGEQ